MYTVISVLVFIICILLIFIVLVQNSKGGGLSSSFASSNQIMGVRKTTDFLEKATWTLAIALITLCVVSVAFIPRGENANQSAIQEQLQEQSEAQQQAIPAFGEGTGVQAEETQSTSETPVEPTAEPVTPVQPAE